MKQTETEIAVLQVKLANLDEKISNLRGEIADLREEMEDYSEKVSKVLKEFREENAAAHALMATKIASLEKWKWMVMGAGIAVGTVASFLLKLFI